MRSMKTFTKQPPTNLNLMADSLMSVESLTLDDDPTPVVEVAPTPFPGTNGNGQSGQVNGNSEKVESTLPDSDHSPDYSTFRKKKRDVLPEEPTDVGYLTFRREKPSNTPGQDDDDKYKTFVRRPVKQEPEVHESEDRFKTYRLPPKRSQSTDPPVCRPVESGNTAIRGRGGAPKVPPKPPGIRVRETKTTLLRRQSPSAINPQVSLCNFLFLTKRYSQHFSSVLVRLAYGFV